MENDQSQCNTFVFKLEAIIARHSGGFCLSFKSCFDQITRLSTELIECEILRKFYYQSELTTAKILWVFNTMYSLEKSSKQKKEQKEIIREAKSIGKLVIQKSESNIKPYNFFRILSIPLKGKLASAFKTMIFELKIELIKRSQGVLLSQADKLWKLKKTMFLIEIKNGFQKIKSLNLKKQTQINGILENQTTPASSYQPPKQENPESYILKQNLQTIAEQDPEKELIIRKNSRILANIILYGNKRKSEIKTRSFIMWKKLTRVMVQYDLFSDQLNQIIGSSSEIETKMEILNFTVQMQTKFITFVKLISRLIRSRFAAFQKILKRKTFRNLCFRKAYLNSGISNPPKSNSNFVK